MSMIHGARREIQRLRRKLRAEDQDFRAAAPTVDEDGLPCWGDTLDLPLDAYTRALDGDIPDEDLTDEELEARVRLAPYAGLFERLERDATEEAGT